MSIPAPWPDLLFHPFRLGRRFFPSSFWLLPATGLPLAIWSAMVSLGLPSFPLWASLSFSEVSVLLLLPVRFPPGSPGQAWGSSARGTDCKAHRHQSFSQAFWKLFGVVKEDSLPQDIYRKVQICTIEACQQRLFLSHLRDEPCSKQSKPEISITVHIMNPLSWRKRAQQKPGSLHHMLMAQVKLRRACIDVLLN